MCLWGLDWGYILTWRSWTLCWSQFGEFNISSDWVYPLKVATKATKSKTNSCPFLQKEISTQEQYCSTWSQHPTPATQPPPLWHLSTNRGAGFHGSQHQLQFQPFHRQMHSRNTLWRWTLNNFAREQQPTSRWNLKLEVGFWLWLYSGRKPETFVCFFQINVHSLCSFHSKAVHSFFQLK